MQQIIDQMTLLSARLDEHLKPLVSDLVRLGNTIAPTVEAFILYDKIAKAREVTGWLPYRTVPFTEFFRECGDDVEALSAKISGYYETHELDIIGDIDSELARYDVDDEAKATLKEALKAHKCGLFRCTCRVLPPEIERVIREDWLGIRDVKTLNPNRFEKAINTNEKALSDFILNGPQDLVLFGLFANHLFAWVESRENVAREPTPNRHAASHGWIPYSSRQSSLNAIICADYIFRLTTSFKAEAAKAEAEEVTDHHVARP